MKTEAPKVKHPHPLMQQGTPPQDVEREHIGFFTVFRLGGGGPPKHVETINNPEQFLEPSTINALVGGGDYVVKACANGQTSGRQHGSVLSTTNFAWDGPPNIRTAPATAFHAQTQAATAPQQSFFEQAASQGPAIVGAITAGLGGIMQIINSGREAREREERARREYEEGRRREEREERDRKEAAMRQEADERREAERRRDEERRDRERQEAEERRGERERMEQARLDQMRADAEARQARETMLLNAVMTRKDPNEAIMLTLAQRALNPPAPPLANPTASVDSVLDAAMKLKEFTDGGDEKMAIAALQAFASPAGSEILRMVSGLFDKRRAQEEPTPVITPEPAVSVEQLPPATPEFVPPVPPPQQEIVPGPVTIN